MSPSKLTCAPDTGLAASLRWKLTVTGPTRTGFGLIFLSLTLVGDLAADLEQATIHTIPENTRRVGSTFVGGRRRPPRRKLDFISLLGFDNLATAVRLRRRPRRARRVPTRRCSADC